MEIDIKKYYELHDQTIQWINEIQFMADEQIFLEHLLSSHFLELSSSKLYETTKKLIRKLKEAETTGNDLMDMIQMHNNNLGKLIENFNEDGQLTIDREHIAIKKDLEDYILKFRYVKKKIFGIIKQILKDHKQKLLIKNT
jgi:hypothetical protein